jgi:RNA polymerase sigma-70 factor (ECF subfamily)
MAVPAAAPDPQDAPGRVGRVAFDAESQAWLARLQAAGPDRDAAISELLSLLVQAARFVLLRRRAQIGSFPREELDDLAAEAAGDALMAIMARLDEYRGESRFTTWAWKFAFYQASEAIRRRTWMGREIPTEDAGWSAVARHGSPESALEQRELLAAVKAGTETALTPHQRTVFVALALNNVPVDVLAERMGTTRGALYKTLHEARSRLRDYLDSSAARWWNSGPKEWVA